MTSDSDRSSTLGRPRRLAVVWVVLVAVAVLGFGIALFKNGETAGRVLSSILILGSVPGALWGIFHWTQPVCDSTASAGQ